MGRPEMVECFGCGILITNRYGRWTRCPACDKKRRDHKTEMRARKEARKALKRKLDMATDKALKQWLTLRGLRKPNASTLRQLVELV